MELGDPVNRFSSAEVGGGSAEREQCLCAKVHVLNFLSFTLLIVKQILIKPEHSKIMYFNNTTMWSSNKSLTS